MTTRQEIYDRIRATSKDEVILAEMIRLGFWPRGTGLPDDPADELRRRGELEREWRALTAENRRLGDAQALRRAARKERLEASRRKRQETRRRRLRERAERAAAWRRRTQNEIVYLGEGVSSGLGRHAANEEKLEDRQLPVLATAAELARAMGLDLSELRFLSFFRRTSRVSHYRRFAIPKKSGGRRIISAPMPRLKQAQLWVLFHVLERVPLHDAAHGFRKGRSIVTNAEPHVGRDVVINLDLKDFFPTVTYPRVKGVFASLGYSEEVSTVLGLLCTEPEISEVRLDGRTYYVTRSERFLPQGAPTSPALTNIICRGLDARLSRAAATAGFRYTRYADDLTFSGPGDPARRIGRLLRQIHYIVGQEGFHVHPEKTRVQRRGGRQEVTGLTVNERIGVARPLLRRFRALLHQVERDGPEGRQWGPSGHVLHAMEGFANFVKMVNPEKGSELQRRVRELVERHGYGPVDWTQRARWTARRGGAPRSFADGDPLATRDVIVEATLVTAEEPAPPAPNAARDDASPARKKKPWWKFW